MHYPAVKTNTWCQVDRNKEKKKDFDKVLNFNFKQPHIPSSYHITQQGCKGYNNVYKERLILPLTVNVLVYESPDLFCFISAILRVY